ncbi:MAG: AMP-binding protein [Actinobacteria bacterium]|nr:AMP-binding protein [Actinomycetota bacterium]
MTTFWDELLAPERLAQELWEWTGERFERQCFDDVLQTARHVAAGLRRRGVGPGSVVPAVITNMPDATAGYVGIWAAGAAIASLPIPARGMSVEGYVRQLDALCKLVGSPFFLAEERFLQFMPPDAPIAAEGVGYRSLVETPERADVEPPDPDGTVFVQFSSGTTGEPRGVQLSGRAMDAQMRMLMERMRIDPQRDVGYIWLPLSHDMGFFGCNLLAIYTGMRGIRSTPERFLMEPRSWFADCAEMGVTVTAGPPSALHLAARAERSAGGGEAKPLDLRVCLVGAEPVQWEVLETAADALAPRGLSLDTFTVAYGLAEATLAVTIGALGAPPRYLHVDGDALANGRIEEVAGDAADARRILSTGTPVGATEVEVDPLTSEIVVRSPSLADGYLHQPEATAARFRDGAVRTGDIGFVRDGELYVVGRSDDVLIVGGRNVYVHEVEAEMGADPAIREGNCAIVESHRDGRARIGVLCELASARGNGDGEAEQPDAVSDRLRAIALERAGLSVDEVVFLDPGAFPKTPSGKVQRFRCRELLGRTR